MFREAEELEALQQIPCLEQWPSRLDVAEGSVLKAFYTFAELEAFVGQLAYVCYYKDF